ncbi:lactadherin-like [Strongylocentrotus purpuratus]|uniref:F5/8 type C domain-containing protein n=1 Tax=Strongylocentrotus purpuratus TaxID=7668 RepID=A0A7M7SWX9_STRPU|nr:lactadherin-like [Strongylocentrotus purpuratus]
MIWLFATVSGPLYESSSVDAPAEAESVICPANATNITDCWYSEIKVGLINENEIISIVCCPVNPCNISGQPLGLESGALPDSAFSESSCYSASQCSRSGRLNSATVWAAYSADQYQWMQVQFESSYIVTAITTQGRNNADQWVTSYTISSSFDNTDWTDYLNVYSGSVEIFPGNYDRDSHVTHTLARPIVGRSFRIHPKTNHGYISLRMELYGYGPLTDAIASMNLDAKLGCAPSVLGVGLGVEDGRIPDSSLTSSSITSSGHEAYRGRLNGVSVPRGSGGWVSAGAWVAALYDNNKWLKVDLGEDTLVTGVITQGRTGTNQRVTSFQISYSRDNTNWTFALEEQCGVRKSTRRSVPLRSYGWSASILFCPGLGVGQPPGLIQSLGGFGLSTSGEDVLVAVAQ